MNGEDQVQDDINEQEQQREFERIQVQDRMILKERAKAKVRQGMSTVADKIPGSEKLQKDIEKISGEKHSTNTWIIALLIALTKDLIDIGTIGATFIVNWVVDPCIWLAMMFLFGWKRQLAKKLVIWGVTALLKIVPIPLEDFIPWWTLSILLLYLTSDFRAKGAEHRVKKANK